MDAHLFIVAQIDDECREMTLSDLGAISWTDGQSLRASRLRLERDDALGWSEFIQRLDADHWLADAVKTILITRGIVMEIAETNKLTLKLPPFVKQLSMDDETQLLSSLNVNPYFIVKKETDKFTPPLETSRGEIMYVEMKPGLSGPARITRVTFSKSRKTIYYDGKALQSLKGSGFKANYHNVESGMQYWISKCHIDGNDRLYPGIVEIDEDVREEYWTRIRQQPEKRHLNSFRSSGKYGRGR